MGFPSKLLLLDGGLPVGLDAASLYLGLGLLAAMTRDSMTERTTLAATLCKRISFVFTSASVPCEALEVSAAGGWAKLCA